MTRGFHAFFRQYYNLRGLLRRTDPALARLTPLPDYPLRHSAGLPDSFARLPRTPPFSALGFVALSPTFGWRDLVAMDARAALPLLDVRVPEVYQRFDETSAPTSCTACASRKPRTTWRSRYSRAASSPTPVNCPRPNCS